MITKRNGKYYCTDANGKPMGGPYDTEAEAKTRDGQVGKYKAVDTFNTKPDKPGY